MSFDYVVDGLGRALESPESGGSNNGVEGGVYVSLRSSRSVGISPAGPEAIHFVTHRRSHQASLGRRTKILLEQVERGRSLGLALVRNYCWAC